MLRDHALSTSSSAQRCDKPIRVCIRAIAGTLGRRLALAIRRCPDLHTTVGIVKKDRTLEKAFQRMKRLADGEKLPPETIRKMLWPEKIYLDERHRVVREVNSQCQGMVEFEPADQLNLSDECDIVLDAAANGLAARMKKYQHFHGPVVLQSGDYPHGRLLVPPFPPEQGDENIFRQGDCVLSSVGPALSALQEVAVHIRMDILTQYTDKLNDYTLDDAITATHTRPELKSALLVQLFSLVPHTRISIGSMLQRPGLSFYTISLQLETTHPMAGKDLKELLSNQPRILTIPFITSTQELCDYRETIGMLGKSIPPIVVTGQELNSTERSIHFELTMFIDYRYVAVLPNIDAVSMIMLGMSGAEAMHRTDTVMGF